MRCVSKAAAATKARSRRASGAPGRVPSTASGAASQIMYWGLKTRSVTNQATSESAARGDATPAGRRAPRERGEAGRGPQLEAGAEGRERAGGGGSRGRQREERAAGKRGRHDVVAGHHQRS